MSTSKSMVTCTAIQPETCILQVTSLQFAYADRQVLKQVSFSLYEHERLALVGGNGAGKSTLLRLLVGLSPCGSGAITGFGKQCSTEADFHRLRTQIGFLFQDSDDQLFCPTVLEDVAFGPLNLGQTRPQAIATALTTLRQLGLETFADRVTYRLSGGEKRMVALATVLAMEPRILLLDEPTNGLDTQAEERLLSHLETLDQAMIIVSHDQRVIDRLATRAMVLEQGQIKPAVLHRHPHQHSHEHTHIHAITTADTSETAPNGHHSSPSK
ncbi:energy-coupling factor ABC transporter ATP-binding protein [Celerinatantimonas sp. YJH-8]|uniref:energy-coupling factor ABC transporter ATP-binding protein n=1 Tax=Celerinatantimonas sp. YJH-8 TaxID=3228714 RepID=UPI0038C51C4A